MQAKGTEDMFNKTAKVKYPNSGKETSSKRHLKCQTNQIKKELPILYYR